MHDLPEVPAAIRLRRQEQADSAREEAVRQAGAGAEEGTLIWVDRPQHAPARAGRQWQLTEGAPGLHAALILRPGLSAHECAQLGPTVLVAIARAVGTLLQPMTELHYRWPNDLLLDGGKAAGVWLDGGPERDGRIDWLVVSWAINTGAAPDPLGFDAAALEREGVADPIDHAALLQSIVRQIVAAIGTWDEAGFEPIRRSWEGRLSLGSAIHIADARGATIAGVAESIAEDGTLTVRADSTSHDVTLEDFFGLTTDVTT